MTNEITVLEKDFIEPHEYFAILKESVETEQEIRLQEQLKNISQHIVSCHELGQKAMKEKLSFLYDCINREQKLLAYGINKFVKSTDIVKYITKAVVKEPNPKFPEDRSKDKERPLIRIIDLDRYQRIIPQKNAEDIKFAKNLTVKVNEIIGYNILIDGNVQLPLPSDTLLKTEKEAQEKILLLKKEYQNDYNYDITPVYKDIPLFDDFVIVFTDLVGDSMETPESKQFKARNLDPIVFGYFCIKEADLVHEKMYFITDWEDENCDLTLDKLLDKMKQSGVEKPLYEISANSETYINNIVQETITSLKKNNYDVYEASLNKQKVQNEIEMNKPEKQKWYQKLFKSFT